MTNKELIFDTHSHYDDEAFEADRHQLLTELCTKGIGNVVNVGADMETSRTALALAEQYDFVYAALGVHQAK